MGTAAGWSAPIIPTPIPWAAGRTRSAYSKDATICRRALKSRFSAATRCGCSIGNTERRLFKLKGPSQSALIARIQTESQAGVQSWDVYNSTGFERLYLFE